MNVYVYKRCEFNSQRWCQLATDYCARKCPVPDITHIVERLLRRILLGTEGQLLAQLVCYRAMMFPYTPNIISTLAERADGRLSAVPYMGTQREWVI